MKDIHADTKSIRQLLGGTKFSIDYYQREYQWQGKQVGELVEDLTGKFGESYQEGDSRAAVEGYGRYFLGSIIISNKNGQRFIVDGQQRLTTLTLLLIYLHNALEDKEQKGQVAELIFSTKFGRRSYNLDVEERDTTMESLYQGKPLDDADLPESVQNIVARYGDIEEVFPDEAHGEALPYFTDWLIENVYLVEITAFSDEDAYTIFETMNDRGLSLAPADMLKGYLLANVTESQLRKEASEVWRQLTESLKRIGKEEDADALKAWLRSQHAQTIRERKRGAEPRDFDRIGTEFHRWVRDQAESLKLSSAPSFAGFITRDFAFYGKWFGRLRQFAEGFEPPFQRLRYLADLRFTLQYPVALAPLRIDDTEKDINRKIRATSAYLDILVARRIWNFRAIDYSTMQYAMFLLMREIRGMPLSNLVNVLRDKLDAEEEVFARNRRLRIHGTNGRLIHRLLARITEYVEVESGEPSRYQEYVARTGRQRYEVEHIWAREYAPHMEEFDHEADFREYRNRIGGLLLLPKQFNASYGDEPYDVKLKYYIGQNLLAKSLHENCYEHNPGFLAFVKRSGLPFKAHPTFTREDLDVRQDLYLQLAEHIWHPELVEREAQG